MLDAMQQGLEELYRIETGVDVRDFVIDSRTRARLGQTAAAREQLLVRQADDDALELALYVDDAALANLKRNDPRQRLDCHNLDDFCLTFEGVSHFVYLTYCAQRGRPVTGLELELQAEVDKYLACVLLTWDGPPPADLRARLFGRVSYQVANDNERERYITANRLADRYCRGLEKQYLEERQLPKLLADARRFYRCDQGAKLDRIAAASAR